MPIRTDPVLPEEDWQLRLDVLEDGSAPTGCAVSS